MLSVGSHIPDLPNPVRHRLIALKLSIIRRPLVSTGGRNHASQLRTAVNFNRSLRACPLKHKFDCQLAISVQGTERHRNDTQSEVTGGGENGIRNFDVGKQPPYLLEQCPANKIPDNIRKLQD